MLRAAGYRPFDNAGLVVCPLLVCVCDDDAITPAAPAVAGAERAPRGEVRRYPIGHFDIYLGEWFDRAVADQTAFLEASLGLPVPAGSPAAKASPGAPPAPRARSPRQGVG